MLRLRFFTFTLIALATLASLVVFQGCAKFNSVAAKPRVFTFDFASMSAAVLQPPTDKLDADCMTKSDYDACLFFKNPVAQSKTALTGSVLGNNYDTTQIYGVKIVGVASTTKLENDTFSVESLHSPPVTAQSQLKVTAQNDKSDRFSQLMAYYWLNRAASYIGAHTGSFPARGKKIRVVVGDLFNGWSSRNNSLHLKGGDNPAAWSPELAIHYLGLANLHYASNGASDNPSPGQHRDCRLTPAGCCQTAAGCGRAIASGVGDYFVGMVFPDQPVVGETWANRVDGLTNCGLSRNLEGTLTQISSQAAFDACASSGRQGDISMMGGVYASIWWQVRKAAAKQFPKGTLEIDALFINHLSDLGGDDDFRSALNKIRALDHDAFQGRHIPLFEAEFAARGL